MIETDPFIAWVCERIRSTRHEEERWDTLTDHAKKVALVLRVCPWGPSVKEIGGIVALVDVIAEEAGFTFARGLVATIENARSGQLEQLPPERRQLVLGALGRATAEWKTGAAPPAGAPS